MSIEVARAARRHEVRHLVEEVVELLQGEGIVQGFKRSNGRRSKDSCCLEKRDGVKSEMDEKSLSGNPESDEGAGVQPRDVKIVWREAPVQPPLSELPSRSFEKLESSRVGLNVANRKVWLGNASLFNCKPRTLVSTLNFELRSKSFSDYVHVIQPQIELNDRKH